MAGSWQDRADWACPPVLGLVGESPAEVGKMPVQIGSARVESIWHMSCPAGGVEAEIGLATGKALTLKAGISNIDVFDGRNYPTGNQCAERRNPGGGGALPGAGRR
jgi:hypothetical protein